MAEYKLTGKRVWIAGHTGMVGKALMKRLEAENCEVLTVGRASLDLTERHSVATWCAREKPEAVFLAAARVGGIMANDTAPVDFLQDNLLIATTVIAGAYEAGVEKVLNLGSSCIYPRLAPQPIPEAALLTGPLEPTNQWYAIAKIAAIMLGQAYRKQYGADMISAMPTNLYGPGDNFDLTSSHVMPALIRKVHEAKQTGAPVTIWGTGTPRREFLYVDDCADACVFLMKHYSDAEHVNVGSGQDIAIADLVGVVMEVVGYDAPVIKDTSKPDGTPRKLMSSAKLTAMGWTPQIPLEQGLAETYRWFLKQDTIRA